MALTVGFALLAALLCTITLTPGLAYIALRQPRKLFHNRPLERLQHAYSRALERLLKHLPATYAVTGVALLAVVLLGASLGREFLPERFFLVGRVDGDRADGPGRGERSRRR